MKHFIAANGRPSRYPTSYEHAVECKSAFYDDGVKCSTCNEMTVKYTYDHTCRFCALLDAANFYNLYEGNSLVFTDENTGEHFARLTFGKLLLIPDDKYAHMVKYVEIAKSGHEYTVGTNPCNTRAHYGMKRLGKCYQCKEVKSKLSPRQQAMADNETWYTPDMQCVKCGTKSLKSVHTGQCQGCIPLSSNTPDKRETPDSIMMRESPDMVISKADAIEYGFKIFRTGNPCIRRHTGWRYVSTGTCIECLRS